MRRALRILSVTLITAGIVFLVDVAMTLAWKEPVSAIFASLQQAEAADELESVRENFLELPQVSDVEGGGRDPERRIAELAELFARSTEDGKAIGRIVIPSIDADFVFVEGTGTTDLQRGPGRYPETAMPGEGQTVGIAGHRTTYGAPFGAIDSIEAGDPIELDMPYGTFTYEVTSTRIVDPDRIEVVEDVGRERLVLSACHPRFSAAQRYIVFADLVRTEPASGAQPPSAS